MNSRSVSVLMPVFNGEKHIEKALESVESQTEMPHQIIVVNDGSTDRTRRILETFPKYFEIYNRKHEGLSKALNAGLRRVDGDFLAYLSSDDYWRNSALEVFLDHIDVHGVAYSDFFKLYWVNRDIEHIAGRKSPDYSKSRLRKECFINCSVSLVETSVLWKIEDRDGFIFDPSLESCMDWDLWIRLSDLTSFVHIPEFLGYYRVHKGQMSRSQRVFHHKQSYEVFRRYNRFSFKEWIGCQRRLLLDR